MSSQAVPPFPRAGLQIHTTHVSMPKWRALSCALWRRRCLKIVPSEATLNETVMRLFLEKDPDPDGQTPSAPRTGKQEVFGGQPFDDMGEVRALPNPQRAQQWRERMPLQVLQQHFLPQELRHHLQSNSPAATSSGPCDVGNSITSVT